jgi:hypothetical protein
MGRQSRREHSVRVIEHTAPLGGCASDLGKAWGAAEREWKLLNPDRSLPDDWATVHADDDSLIIRIEVRE